MYKQVLIITLWNASTTRYTTFARHKQMSEKRRMEKTYRIKPTKRRDMQIVYKHQIYDILHVESPDGKSSLLSKLKQCDIKHVQSPKSKT